MPRSPIRGSVGFGPFRINGPVPGIVWVILAIVFVVCCCAPCFVPLFR